MNTALITGACGFVGNALAHMLAKQGWQLHLFDLPDNPRWADTPIRAGITRFQGDIRSREQITSAVKGCTHIFHTAALLNSIAPDDAFLSINLLGTETLCEAAIEEGVERLFYFSTSDVFGIPQANEIMTENSPFRRWYEPYADSKIAATERVKYYIHKYRLPATIVYPGWVYGPGDRQFFPAVINMVRDKWVFTWHRRRPYEVDLIHVNDLMNAVKLMLQNPASIGEDFLILDSATKMTPELFYRLVAEVLNIKITILKLPYALMWLIAWCSQTLTRKGFTRKHLLSTTDVKAFGNDFHFSTEKARKMLGWQPETTAKDGVRQAVHWQLQGNA